MEQTENKVMHITPVSDALILEMQRQEHEKKKRIKRVVYIIIGIIALFIVINYRMIFAGVTNTFRFVTFSASRYDEICERVYADILARKSIIEIDDSRSGDPALLQRLGHEFAGNYPELFYISVAYSDKSLHITYLYSDDEIDAMTYEFNAMLDGIVSQAEALESPVEKLKFFHDYIIENYSYSLEYGDAYSMLKYGRGKCSAYALLYKALLDRCGIVNETVWSTYANHEWNEVRIGGFWYQVDVTWDDADMGEPRYKYFLMTDNAILGRGHSQWINCGAYSHACYSPYYMIKYADLPKDIEDRTEEVLP